MATAGLCRGRRSRDNAGGGVCGSAARRAPAVLVVASIFQEASEACITRDLEAMKAAGISNLIFLEVGIGVPRGPVNFMSDEWQELFVHAVRESERLGIKILLTPQNLAFTGILWMETCRGRG